MDQGQQDKLDERLINAVRRGDIPRVKRLLAAGADVNARDKYGRTALYWPVCFGRIGCMRLLIEAGADVNNRDSDGWTPLHEAAYCELIACMRILIEAGADTEIKDNCGSTPGDILSGENPGLYEKYAVCPGFEPGIQEDLR